MVSKNEGHTRVGEGTKFPSQVPQGALLYNTVSRSEASQDQHDRAVTEHQLPVTRACADTQVVVTFQEDWVEERDKGETKHIKSEAPSRHEPRESPFPPFLCPSIICEGYVAGVPAKRGHHSAGISLDPFHQAVVPSAPR